MEATARLAGHIGQHSSKGHADGKYDAGIARCHGGNVLPPILQRPGAGKVATVRTLVNHTFTILLAMHRSGQHIAQVMPADTGHAAQALGGFRMVIQHVFSQLLPGLAVDGDGQPTPRQFAAELGGVAGRQHFHRAGPAVWVAVVVFPRQQAAPVALLGVAGFAQDVQW